MLNSIIVICSLKIWQNSVMHLSDLGMFFFLVVVFLKALILLLQILSRHISLPRLILICIMCPSLSKFIILWYQMQIKKFFNTLLNFTNICGKVLSFISKVIDLSPQFIFISLAKDLFIYLFYFLENIFSFYCLNSFNLKYVNFCPDLYFFFQPSILNLVIDFSGFSVTSIQIIELYIIKLLYMSLKNHIRLIFNLNICYYKLQNFYSCL